MYELQQSSTETARNGRRAMSFAAGAIVGAGIALLLAPSAGKDIRRGIGHTAKRVGSGARQAIDRARGTVDAVRDDARAAVERGRESFNQSRRPETRSGWQTQAG